MVRPPPDNGRHRHARDHGDADEGRPRVARGTPVAPWPAASTVDQFHGASTNHAAAVTAATTSDGHHFEIQLGAGVTSSATSPPPRSAR